MLEANLKIFQQVAGKPSGTTRYPFGRCPHARELAGYGPDVRAVHLWTPMLPLQAMPARAMLRIQRL
jgi:hypothetical protein